VPALTAGLPLRKTGLMTPTNANWRIVKGPAALRKRAARLRTFGYGGQVTDPNKSYAEHSFECSRCGQWAGTVQLCGPPDDPHLVRSSFTSHLTARLDADKFDAMRTLIAGGDAAGLHAADLEYAPFFCPKCAASYCGAHWQQWDIFDDEGWHDMVRGRCPEGHERLLED
jgi:hypothetical protein